MQAKKHPSLDRFESDMDRGVCLQMVQVGCHMWGVFQEKHKFPRMQKSLQCIRTWTETHETAVRFLVLAAVLMVMFLRGPSFFLSPRLWAEEGRDYFSNAYYYANTELWYRGLFFLYAGYLSLWPNIATTIAANCVSLENVPDVTLLFSVTAQLIPFTIVLWSVSSFWRSTLQKTAGVFILLFAPISGEVWVSTILSQVFFAITTFLLLLEDVPVTTLRRWTYRVLLVLAGLTGPISSILSPLFLIEAYHERKKERWIQSVFLSACAMLQAYFMFFMSSRGACSVFDSSAYIFSLGTQSVGVIFLGLDGAGRLAKVILSIYAHGGYLCTAGVFVCSFVIGLILFFLSRGIPTRERRILVGVYLFLSVVSFYGALGQEKMRLIDVGPGARYFYASNVVFLLLVLARIREPFRLGTFITTIALMIAITFGVRNYKRTLIWNNLWPNWNAEVQAWREDPSHLVAIWPPDMKVTLRKWSQEPSFSEPLVTSSRKETRNNAILTR